MNLGKHVLLGSTSLDQLKQYLLMPHNHRNPTLPYNPNVFLIGSMVVAVEKVEKRCVALVTPSMDGI